jgi:hypothetical protein
MTLMHVLIGMADKKHYFWPWLGTWKQRKVALPAWLIDH